MAHEAAIFIFIGVLIVFLGILLAFLSLFSRGLGSGDSRSYGVVLLGPIPIVFRGGFTLGVVFISIVLAVFILVLLFLFL